MAPKALQNPKDSAELWESSPAFQALQPRVCKRWFPNGGSSFVRRSFSASPFLPQFNPPFTSVLLLLTSFLPLLNLNLTSASSGISNHGLETTVYKPLVQFLPQITLQKTVHACACVPTCVCVCLRHTTAAHLHIRSRTELHHQVIVLLALSIIDYGQWTPTPAVSEPALNRVTARDPVKTMRRPSQMAGVHTDGRIGCSFLNLDSTFRPAFPVLVFQLSEQQNRIRTTSSTKLGTAPNHTQTRRFPFK